MFKKLHKEIKSIYEQLDRIFNRVDYRYSDIDTNIKVVREKVGYMPDVKSMQKTIDSQQRTIEQLTNALVNKYEHGLFIFSEDGRNPMVIRNGKELTNKMTTYFDVAWKPGEIPYITIEQCAATYHDMEE